MDLAELTNYGGSNDVFAPLLGVPHRVRPQAGAQVNIIVEIHAESGVLAVRDPVPVARVAEGSPAFNTFREV